jgi:hypothetical protein
MRLTESTKLHRKSGVWGTQLRLPVREAELGRPEAFMHFARLVFEEWAVDDDVLLPAGKHFAARQVESGILLVAAGISHQAGLRQGEDDAAQAGPVDCAGAHSAGFGAGVQGAAGKFGFAQQPGSFSTGDHFRVLGGIAGREHCVVTRGDNGLASLIYDQRTERMAAIAAGLAR